MPLPMVPVYSGILASPRIPSAKVHFAPGSWSKEWPRLHACDWAHARLEMYLQPSVQSLPHAGCGLSELRACIGSIPRPTQASGASMLPAMHARWVSEGFMPRRPRIACLCGCVYLFTSWLVLCLLTSVYQITRRRPTDSKARGGDLIWIVLGDDSRGYNSGHRVGEIVL
jgi:hypothetical protein